MNHTFDLDIDQRLSELCKPPGSLGHLETIAAQLARVQQTLEPRTRPRQVTIFAADHGVTVEGVSAWPSSVTRAVVEVMQTARTASGVFAKSLDCGYEIVDIGLLEPTDPASCNQTNPLKNLIVAAKRRGTGNLAIEAAMTEHDFEYAWSVGAERASLAAASGCRLLMGGEMGIGNTTSASCLVGLLTEAAPMQLVGRGAGLCDAGMIRKHRVVERAIQRVREFGNVSTKRIVCEVGGLEIVALAGYFAEGARLGMILLIDGFITTAAALVAESIATGTRDAMIAGHRSSEPGHNAALDKLELVPILDLQMRLGEGTGALAALPLLDLAAAMISEMATLQELRMP